MKKFLLFASVLTIWATQLNAQVIINENFDSYTVGNPAAQEAGAPWTTWSMAPGGTEDPLISNTQSSSPSNSVYVNSTAYDYVVDFGDLTTGIYDITFNMFVETGKMGYFNVLNDFAGGSSIWAMESYIRSSGYISWSAGGVDDSTTFAFDTWTEIGFHVDLNSDTAIMSVGGTDVMGWKFSTGSAGTGTTLKLDAMDFYGASEGAVMPGYYIDDFVFENTTSVGVVESNNMISVYPNPANDRITISGIDNAQYEIMNIAGQVVLAGTIENNFEQVSVSGLNNGLYFVRITGSDVVVKSFVVE